jgi:hypothetical protein
MGHGLVSERAESGCDMGGLPGPIPREISERIIIAQLKAGFEESFVGIAAPDELEAILWTLPAAEALGGLEEKDPQVVEKAGLRSLADREAFVVSLTCRGAARLKVVLIGRDAIDRLANCQGLPCPKDLAFYAAQLAKLVVVFGNSVLIELRRPQMEAMCAAIQMGARLRPRWVELANPANPRYVLLAWIPERDASE